jgi:hypothetical protein
MFFPSRAAAIAVIVTNIILGIIWMIFILTYLANIISFNRECDEFDEACSSKLKNMQPPKQNIASTKAPQNNNRRKHYESKSISKTNL